MDLGNRLCEEKRCVPKKKYFSIEVLRIVYVTFEQQLTPLNYNMGCCVLDDMTVFGFHGKLSVRL